MLFNIFVSIYNIGKQYLFFLEPPLRVLWSLWMAVVTFCINPMVLLYFSIFAITSVTYIVVSWVRYRKAQHKIFANLGIPFVKPHFVYGSLHLLRNNPTKENEIQIMDKWIKEHGKVFGYFIGSTPHLLVADVDFMKEILIKKSANYLNRPKLAIQANPVMDTLVGLRGQRWKDVRGLLSPAFTAAKLKPMMKTMNDKVDILSSIIERATVTSNGELEWLTTYQGLSLDIISSCAFAMETNCMEEQNNDPLFAAVRDFLVKAINSAVLWAQYFPFVAVLMTFINNYWMKSGKATIMIVASLEKAIHARRKDPNARRKDILQVILDSSEQEFVDHGKGNIKVKPLSDKEIVANSWVFLLGGYETTASALAFTTYLLAKHPDVQEKLYQEIKANISPDKELTYEDIMNLSYLDQVLNESLRLYPPVSSFLQRETHEADKVKGIPIPGKTTIVVPIWQIHHDPELWHEPYKFDPNRFTSDAKTDPNRHPLAFIPFGSGPRTCIGMRFGQVTSKLALTKVLLKYRLEMCERSPTDLTLLIPTVSLTPKEKIILRAVNR